MINPIFTVEEAWQADNARRSGRLDDPQLKKLGELSVSLDVDVQRIWLQTELCCQYLNLQPAWVRAQESDQPTEVNQEERIGDQLDAIWEKLCFQEEKALQSCSLNLFDDSAFDPAEYIKIPPMFRQAFHHGDRRDSRDPRVPRLFQPETGFNSYRTPEENKILSVLFRAHEVMACNDPGQKILAEMHQLLKDFGLNLNDHPQDTGTNDE